MDTQKPTAAEVSRSDDFTSKYANHVQFQLSFWDMKMLFGQTDQNVGPQAVVQHTAVTIPWPQVKIMAHLLQTNLAVHEYINGRVPVPGGVIPAPEAIAEAAEQFQDSEGIHKIMMDCHNAFVKENPEAVTEHILAKPKRK